MKTLVIVLDSCLCILLIISLIIDFYAEYLLAIILIILNIISINSNKDSKGWLSLYLKRKKLEEQKKIDELSSK